VGKEFGRDRDNLKEGEGGASRDVRRFKGDKETRFAIFHEGVINVEKPKRGESLGEKFVFCQELL